jgi:hypothetical protein
MEKNSRLSRSLRETNLKTETDTTDKGATRRGGCFTTMIICVLVVVGIIAGNRLWDQIRLARLLGKSDTVVSQIKSGALKPDKDSDITLPPRFAGLSVSGRVYCTYDASDPRALFFPTEVSEGLMAGYVYCETPPSKNRCGYQWLSFRDGETGENSLLFHSENVMLFPLDAPASFRRAHSHWFWAEPYYSY